jgi:predicted outer membrane lipoprotein
MLEIFAIKSFSETMAAADEAVITGLVYEHAEDGNLLQHDDGTA